MNEWKARFVPSGAVRSSSLVLLVLATVMFPRVLTAMGMPAVINFLHFVFVAVLLCLMFSKMRHRTSVDMLIGLLALIGVIAFSALVNSVGFINVVLDSLLLTEPFLFLLAIVSIPWSQAGLKKFRFWLVAIIAVHISFTYYQWLVMGLTGDDVEGIFVNMGAGSHLAGAVALTAAVYLMSAYPEWSMWLRATATATCAAVVIFSDTKQVIGVFFLAVAVLVLLRIKNRKEVVRYLATAIAAGVIAIWAANTVFSALGAWASIDLVRVGVEQKLTVFTIIPAHYESVINWLFGLGPGHTIGRLGWMLPAYYQYLEPLGATISPVTSAVWEAHQGHWISNSVTGSSVFSLFFSWSGVWGDLGLIGLALYLYLWVLVWRKFCLDAISRFLLITVLIFGGVFAWMEEPGYVLFVVSIIGLRWQEFKSRSISRFILVRREQPDQAHQAR